MLVGRHGTVRMVSTDEYQMASDNQKMISRGRGIRMHQEFELELERSTWCVGQRLSGWKLLLPAVQLARSGPRQQGRNQGPICATTLRIGLSMSSWSN